MTDRLHDHDTFGFRRGCLACAQTEADMARSKRSLVKSDLNAIGDALWERVMEGDVTAVEPYSRWMEQNLTIHGIVPSEGAAGLHLSTPV